MELETCNSAKVQPGFDRESDRPVALDAPDAAAPAFLATESPMDATPACRAGAEWPAAEIRTLGLCERCGQEAKCFPPAAGGDEVAAAHTCGIEPAR